MNDVFPRGRDWLRSHLGLSLFRNAYYLMSSSVLTSAVGYVFWIVAVRLFPQDSIGLAAAVLSTTGLIVGIADFGLGVSSIRFLPEAGKNSLVLVNSVITLTAGTAIVLAVLFLLASPLIAPRFVPVARNPGFALLFVAAAAIQSLTFTLGALFLARRRTKYSFYQDTSASFLKLVLMIPIAWLIADARGLVGSNVLALALSTFYALFVLLPRTEPGFRLSPMVSLSILRPMVRYSFGNYAARVFLDAHTLLAPLIVLNLLGGAANAVFYMAWASSMIFRVIPNATFNSLFAEGSNDEASMSVHIRKAIWMTAALLLPASALMIAGANYFLLIIGKRYAAGGSDALRLLVLANIPWSINYLAISIARVRKDGQTVFLVSVALFVAVIASFFVFVPLWGVIGGGFAYLFGQSIVAILVVIVFSARRWLL